MAEEGETDYKVKLRAYDDDPEFIELLSGARFNLTEHLMKPFVANPDFSTFMPRPDLTQRDEDCDAPKVKRKSEISADIKRCVKIASEFELPTKKDRKRKVSKCNLHERIDNIFCVLSIFEHLRKKKLKREDYVNQLVMDLSSYHHYDNFTVEAVVEMLGVMETEAYFCSLGKNLTTCIRINTLKTTRENLQLALSRKQIECKPIYEWSDVGFVVDASESHLSSTAEYADGHFTIQSASSFLPVLALDPQKHEDIADMWASGAEQTAYIAALTENTGTYYVNVDDKSKATWNITRLKVENTKVYSFNVCDVCGLRSFLGNNRVNRVLLCAPSSNTGVISCLSRKTSEEDLMQCAIVQKKLLVAAVNMVDVGGYIVYSTSSIMVEENEAVIDYVLNTLNVRLVSTGIAFGRSGFTNYKGCEFHPSLKETKRFYPHLNNIDGLFVAKLKKLVPSSHKAKAKTKTKTKTV